MILADANAVFCLNCGRRLKPMGTATHRLIVRQASGARSVHDLCDGQTVIGTVPRCDIRITGDSSLSREHARLSISGEHVVIEDLMSSNGTFIRVRQPFVLHDGDEAFIGTSVARLERITPSPHE